MSPRSRSTRIDVAVVGAGLAGLAAGLQVLGTGRSVLVLEARDRVGGRVLNAEIPGGQAVEAGGEFIGPTQTRMAALAKAYRVRTYPTYAQGKLVTIFGGVRSEGAPPAEVLSDYLGMVGRLQAMVDEVRVEAPWEVARAREWDSQTFQTWLDANAETAGGAAMLTAAGHTLWGAEPRDFSLLFFLFYAAAAGDERTPGSFERLVGVTGGAQELRFVGGSYRIAAGMADELGDRISLSTPVRALERSSKRVRVVADGQTIEAEQVVVALPPPLAANIQYEPALPTGRSKLYQHWPLGSLMKCQAVYPEPFWRAAGLSGESITDHAPLDLTFDNTPSTGTPGVLFGFVGGENARRWTDRSPADRRAAVLDNFSAVVGAHDATEYLELDWTRQEWTRGGPGAYTPPGVLLEYGATIRAAVGRIHWAGTETATYWNGYMEGAVRSGERAAEEALAGLSA